MRATAGSAAAPAARCKNCLRWGSFIAVLLPDRLLHARKWRGRAMRAWIDRTNDGLSGMPADGISLPPKRGISARPAGAARRLGYISHATGRKGNGLERDIETCVSLNMCLDVSNGLQPVVGTEETNETYPHSLNVPCVSLSPRSCKWRHRDNRDRVL